jgi:hypothetical protein
MIGCEIEINTYIVKPFAYKALIAAVQALGRFFGNPPCDSTEAPEQIQE